MNTDDIDNRIDEIVVGLYYFPYAQFSDIQADKEIEEAKQSLHQLISSEVRKELECIKGTALSVYGDHIIISKTYLTNRINELEKEIK